MKSKRFHVKSLFSLFLIFTLLFTAVPHVAFGATYNPKEDYKKLDLRFWNDEEPGIEFYINAVSKYTLEKVPEAKFNNEWNVVGLTRGLYTGADYINEIPENYFENYINSVENYVVGKEGNLDRNKLTEWSRTMLSLSALGYNVRNVAGYDFVKAHAVSPTNAIRYNETTGKITYTQGINAAIWGLIAINAGNYSLLDDMGEPSRNTEGKMLDYILEREIVQTDGTVGGWALMGNKPDADIGGMALQALAPYYLDRDKYEATGAQATYEEFAKAVERGILAMKNIQQDNGGFSALGFSGATINSQSIVQIIIALTALGIDPLAENIELKHINENISFITDGGSIDGIETNNMIDALLVFWDPESGSSPEVGGFKNVLSYGADGMATEQSLYGLVAYDRFLKGENSLYDMTDMVNGEYKQLLNAPKHNVLFKVDDVLVENLESSSYAVIEILEGLDKDGKTFIGWNSKSDGSGALYEPGERLVVPNHDITLYAQYENVEYSITFELNGGKFVASNIPNTYTFNDEITLPTADDVLFENYEFKGWYDNEDLTGEPVTKIAKGSFGNKVFYAKWEMSTEEEDEDEPSQTDEEIAKQVENLIAALPSVEEVTLEHKDDVVAAIEAFNNLTDDQKQLVTNVEKLHLLENRLKELENDNSDLPIDDEKEPEQPEQPIDDEKEPEQPEQPIDDEKEPEQPEQPIDDEKDPEEPEQPEQPKESIIVYVDELTNSEAVTLVVNPGDTLIFENKGLKSNSKLVLPDNLPEGTKITIRKPKVNELSLKETTFHVVGDYFDISLQFPNNESYDEGKFVLMLAVDPSIELVNADVYHYNAALDIWELVEADEKNSENHSITVTIPHFSIYAVLAKANHSQDENEVSNELPQNNENNMNHESNDDEQSSSETKNEINEENKETENRTNNDSNETKEAETNKLPSTATSIFNIMLLGLVLLLVGFMTFKITRKVVQ